jgi:hypothetical protein
MEWVGAKHAMHTGWSYTAALYHINQNSWTIGLGTTGTQGVGCVNAGLLCAGDFYEASAVADYAFNKHYDAYVGLNYSEVTDGLANGFHDSGYLGKPVPDDRYGRLPREVLISSRIAFS